MYLVIV